MKRIKGKCNHKFKDIGTHIAKFGTFNVVYYKDRNPNYKGEIWLNWQICKKCGLKNIEINHVRGSLMAGHPWNNHTRGSSMDSGDTSSNLVSAPKGI